MTIEYQDHKLIQMIDMTCLSDQNINEKGKEKLQKYQQLSNEIRERRPELFLNKLVPI